MYERVPHITLKSIANNAEIDVIWEKWQETLEPLRAELNASLNRDLGGVGDSPGAGRPVVRNSDGGVEQVPGGAHERSKVGGASRVEPRVGPRLRAG